LTNPSTMSAAQAEQRNTEDYINRFSTLSRAAIGVVLTPPANRSEQSTRCANIAPHEEPVPRLDACRKGGRRMTWNGLTRNPTHDETVDPIAALKKINDPNSGYEDNGVFVMMYLHKPLTQSFLLVQLIKEYARVLAETHKRLVVLVPPSYQLPEELEDDVVSVSNSTFRPTPNFATIIRT
jgi:hypothetical protein